MISCFSCGNESYRSSIYFISTLNNNRTTRLCGATELGLCPDCIAAGYRRLIRKPSITMVLWLMLSFAALLFSAKLGTSALPYMKIICVIVSIFALYNGVRDVIVVSVYRKRIKNIKAFLPEMTQTDFNEQVNTHLAHVDTIKDGVIFNFTKDNTPIELAKNAKRITRRIKEDDISKPIEGLTTDGRELDEFELDSIRQSICDYFK